MPFHRVASKQNHFCSIWYSGAVGSIGVAAGQAFSLDYFIFGVLVLVWAEQAWEANS